MSQAIVAEIQRRNEAELEHLRHVLKRLGKKNEKGDYVTTFGDIFNDDEVSQQFEGVSATLKNAKQRKMVSYDSPILLQGAHNAVVVTLFADHVPADE
jgi:hypothetical protein